MELIAMLLDLLFPSRCAGCSTRGPGWCPECASSVQGLFAVRRSALTTPAYAVAAYTGAVRKLVLAYKEHGRRELADPIGLLLAAAVPRVLARAGPPLPAVAGGPPTPAVEGGRCWLAAAPSRRAAVRRRGGNHVELAARRAARALRQRGLAVGVGPGLRLGRGARDSVGLGGRDRQANLRGRVLVEGPLPPPGDPVLLVDDVITTGATAATCASALCAAGVGVTAVLAITATV